MLERMKRLLMSVTAGAAGYAAVQHLGRTFGSTRAERQTALPGDGIVERPQIVATHAVTIDARPEDVWPWLVQVGWHRAGWYTARWVDRLLFPANRPSAERVIPELQHLAIGDWIPDGPPEAACGFTVVALERERHLVLESRTHLPRAWRDSFGGKIHWTWSFVLEPDHRLERTRFTFRWQGNVEPGWLAAAFCLVIPPADLLMSRDMLHGVRDRAERRLYPGAMPDVRRWRLSA
jgi:hypothetical protein